MGKLEDFLSKSSHFKSMHPENGEELIEMQNNYLWEIKKDLYCLVSKDVQVEQTQEEQDREIDFWRSRMTDCRMCLISAYNPSAKVSKRQRDTAAAVLPEIFYATTVIVDSFMAQVALKMFLAVKPAKGYILHSSSDYKSALKWIEPYYQKAQKMPIK